MIKFIIGIIIDVTVATLYPKSAITAIIKPKNILPVSPINILAGGKLWNKNPNVLPSIIKDKIISRPPNLFNIMPKMAMVKK